MIIVKLQGGLGNQMFQFAIGKMLARHYRTSFCLDHFFLEERNKASTHIFRNYDLDIFQLNASRATRKDISAISNPSLFEKLAFKTGFQKPFQIIQEKHFHFDPCIFNLNDNLYLDGYWQSDFYFNKIEADLRKDFLFKRSLLKKSLSLIQKNSDKTLVCLNVRRSDFLQNDFHPVCGMNYFLPAIEQIRSKIHRPHFLIFSDDIAWCEQNFNLGHSCTIVDHDHKGEKFDNYLQLMAHCEHFIIPNSSFAWWAVWLANRKNKIVIAPQQWFSDPCWDTKDLIPANWLRLPNN